MTAAPRSTTSGRDSDPRPGAVIHATHAATALRVALAEAADAQWRAIDAAAGQPCAPASPKPAKRTPPKRPAPPKPQRPVVTPRRAAAPTIPPGSLLLSPEEVLAMDHLLATHPALKHREQR